MQTVPLVRGAAARCLLAAYWALGVFLMAGGVLTALARHGQVATSLIVTAVGAGFVAASLVFTPGALARPALRCDGEHLILDHSGILRRPVPVRLDQIQACYVRDPLEVHPYLRQPGSPRPWNPPWRIRTRTPPSLALGDSATDFWNVLVVLRAPLPLAEFVRRNTLLRTVLARPLRVYYAGPSGRTVAHGFSAQAESADDAAAVLETSGIPVMRTPVPDDVLAWLGFGRRRSTC